jgi:hypothetical protein
LAHLRRGIDQVLTDAFYTLLLALDGSASLGGVQQEYRLQDGDGRVLCNGDGTLEALAYDCFQRESGRSSM